jgi:hypothetical protein
MKFTRTQVIIGAALIGLILIIISTALFRSGNPTATPTPTPVGLAFNNYDALLDYGIAYRQRNSLKVAVKNFVDRDVPSTKVTALDPASIVVAPHDPNSSSTISTVNFKLSLDDTTYQAKMNYFGNAGIQLYLTDATGKQVFDSGVIEGKSL